jgi:branched-subunit amino acid aminotransferase/4-amino-4-deoxychorismate lyase
VSRARVLGLAPRLGLDVEIRPIQLSELECAGELFITGSLGGVEPAHLDGPPFHSGPLTEQLAEALRELEFGTPAATGWDAGPLGGRVAERVGVF